MLRRTMTVMLYDYIFPAFSVLSIVTRTTAAPSLPLPVLPVLLPAPAFYTNRSFLYHRYS